MDLERMAVRLRPRNAWEAMDLGIELVRANGRALYGAWLLAYVPVAAAVFALLWDTPLYSQAAPVTPSMFWIGNSETISGFALPATKIDGGQLFHPESPELRYRGPSADRFASSVNPLRNPAGPIYFPSDQYLQQQGATLPSYNADAVGSFNTLMIGGPRFRHTALGCNVLFADGSVRTLYLRPYRKVADGVPGSGSANFVDSDFRRNMLMIKWPPGISDTNTVGTNSTRS